MTEDEAKTKWCPLVRTKCFSAASHAMFAVNRKDNIADNVYCDKCMCCIGSACMLWVWLKKEDGRCGLSIGKP